MDNKQPTQESICIVGTMVPEAEFERLQKKSKVKAAISPNTMQINLFTSLARVCNNVRYVSYPAVATWPRGGVLGTWAKRLKLNDTLWVDQIFMINLPFLKQISVFLSTFFRLFFWALSHRKNKRYIMTYADFSEYCLPALWVGKLFRIPVCLLLTELPGYDHYTTGKRSLKDRLIIRSENFKKKLYSKYDGFVFVSACSAQVILKKDVPWTVVEGFADDTLTHAEDVAKEPVPTAMYAGSLGEAYNIPMLCDAFQAVKGDFRLWICGDGKYREYVQQAAQKDSRITYFGRLPRQTVIDYENRCQLLIHAKSAADEHSRYAFSSKIMEYMISGTPVLTTRVDGVPDEYYSHAFVVEGEGMQALAEALRNTLSLPEEALSKMGKDAQKFLLSQKNRTVQGEKILRMMRSIR